MPKIVVLGEALIDLFTEHATRLKDTAALRPSPGGAPANVAVALGRLGASVGFVGKVGADAFGELLQTTLAEHKVDTRHFTSDNRAPTMLAVVTTLGPDEQQFVLYNGANELLDIADLPASYIENADVFVYGSVTLATRSRDAALKAAELARCAGKQVIFDVNFRPVLWSDIKEAKAQIQVALKTASVIKVNEVELEFLTGTKDMVQGSQHLLGQGTEFCCISLGSRGAYFASRRASGHVPAFKVEVKNTVGSGDAFVAGLASKLSELEQPVRTLSGLELGNIVRFANACGAIVATQEGAMSADLSMAAIHQLIQEQSD